MAVGARGYVGIDGCRQGNWFCVELGPDDAWDFRVLPIDGVGEFVRTARIALIDIPIGLVESGSEGRACDRDARRLLAPRRGSSVFPAPARAAVHTRRFAEAVRINRRLTGRGISRQSWAIAPRIRVIDDLLQRDTGLRAVLRECHPEICFWALNGGTPMRHNKKTVDGRAERMAALRRFFPAAEALLERATARFTRRQVSLDDIVDAMAVAVTAKIGEGRYRTLPPHPVRDATGLPLEMVYCLP